MTTKKFNLGLALGLLTGTAASVACSDAATDMMSMMMNDAGQMLVDAGMDLMDAGDEARDASEAMIDAARADAVPMHYACDEEATVSSASTEFSYTQYGKTVPISGFHPDSPPRVEAWLCERETIGSYDSGEISCASCTGSIPNASEMCTQVNALIDDGSVYVVCGFRQVTSSASAAYGYRYHDLYLTVEN